MEKNVTIPMRSIWSSLIALAIIGFTYILIGDIITGFEKIIELTPETATIKDIGLIWVPIVSYLLISLFICMVVRIFKELKPYKESGLIFGLIIGLIVGLIFGLIVSPIVSYISSLTWSPIFGLIVSPIVSLLGGLIAGLIFGLKKEFKGFISLDFQAFFN